jgi:ATP-dependent helicase HrpA
LRLGEVGDFPFVEPPEYRMVRDGYQTLHEIGAMDEQNQLTDVGYELARLPIDPRIGRMILAARDEGCLEEVLIIAAALSVQDPRERPLDKQDAADAAHAKFRDENSDFVAFLKLWRWYHEQSEHLSASKLRRTCADNFLSYFRMREWHDTHQQLRQLVSEMEPSRPAPHPQAEGGSPKGRRPGSPRRLNSYPASAPAAPAASQPSRASPASPASRPHPPARSPSDTP